MQAIPPDIHQEIMRRLEAVERGKGVRILLHGMDIDSLLPAQDMPNAMRTEYNRACFAGGGLLCAGIKGDLKNTPKDFLVRVSVLSRSVSLFVNFLSLNAAVQHANMQN